MSNFPKGVDGKEVKEVSMKRGMPTHVKDGGAGSSKGGGGGGALGLFAEALGRKLAVGCVGVGGGELL